MFIAKQLPNALSKLILIHKRYLATDQIHIKNLSLDTIVGPDLWNRLCPQKLFITMNIGTNFKMSIKTDDLQHSLDYGVISREVTNFVRNNHDYKSIGHLADKLSQYTVSNYSGIENLALKVKSPNAHIRCDNVTISIYTGINDQPYNKILISNLKLLTLIGIFDFERFQKQYISLNIELPFLKNTGKYPSYKRIIEDIIEYVEKSNFKTVEALVGSVIKKVLQNEYYATNTTIPVNVQVIKINAIPQTDGVGVSCTRFSDEFEGKLRLDGKNHKENKVNVSSYQASYDIDTISNKVILSIGSNVGDRFKNICKAIELLDATSGIKVLQTSSLFESEPMYFKDQNLFLNCCLQLETSLSPHELLKCCKRIEYENLKRTKHFDNGPRTIDLDIIFYKNGQNEHIVINTDDLSIPHPKALERTFVLEPLCELISDKEIHPITTKSFSSHLQKIYQQTNPHDTMWKLIPLSKISDSENINNPRFLRFKRQYTKDEITGQYIPRTISNSYLMGVVNLTPDSFSDGNKNYNDMNIQIQHIKEMVQSALKLHDSVIIDVGGCSTRPNSQAISLKEELERVIPIIQMLRSCKDLPQEKIIMSVDTYRSQVAEKAIEAGIDIINDISGGTFDEKMFNVISKNPDVAYVLSHIRGNTRTMSQLTEYLENSNPCEFKEFLYGKDNNNSETVLIRSIARELSDRYLKAISYGIRRWQIILDPGIGFAKTTDQNINIIKHIPLLKNYTLVTNENFVSFINIPVLLGPSRKTFIGVLTNEKIPKNRDFSTGSIVSSCIGFEADIVRVHDVNNCSKSVKLANYLYRSI